ncbi:MAG: phage terminase large subunit [Acidobacteriales bacterium]|nr:phage terminase large subunit [Terriglobales bacterium]
MSTRLNDLRHGHRVVIQQRLHEQDTTAICLEQGGYVHLCLPEEFEPDRACSTPIGWKDPRTEPGELLWPAKITQVEIADLKVKLGSYRHAGQYQQRPSPAAGGIFQRHWWRYWKRPGTELPPVRVKLADGSWAEYEAVALPPLTEQIQSWDCTFKDTVGADFVCGGVIGSRGADRFVLAVEKERMDFPATCAAIERMSERFPAAAAKLIEDKANGPAVISSLKGRISGLIPINPEGGKIARAHAVSPMVEAGNVYLPHPGIASWVGDFIESLASFPNAAHDDDVDMLTQALARRVTGIFPVAEEDIVVQPFEIPDTWQRAFGMCVGPQAVGVVWGARDPQSDKVYLIDEYFREQADPTIHAAEIQKRGKWIPGAIQARHARSDVDRRRIRNAYQEMGLDLTEARGKAESGLEEMSAAMASGHLKVFATLSRWREEFRVYRRDDRNRIVNESESYCQNAARHFWTTGFDIMKVPPSKDKPKFRALDYSDLRGAWMS